MSGSSRRLVTRCTGRVFADQSFYTLPLPYRPNLHLQQRRSASDDSSGKNDDGSKKSENPILDEYMRKKQEEQVKSGVPDDTPITPSMFKAGDLTSGSIFDKHSPLGAQARGEPSEQDKPQVYEKMLPEHQDAMLNSNPEARRRWERRRVIQMVLKRGKISRAQLIKRQEREHLVRSPNFKTSVKKLGMLARQIAGKPIEEAITQMRFSKKKIAQDVLKQLEQARDEAIVMRGMGLANVTPDEDADSSMGDPSASATRSPKITKKDEISQGEKAEQAKFAQLAKEAAAATKSGTNVSDAESDTPITANKAVLSPASAPEEVNSVEIQQSEIPVTSSLPPAIVTATTPSKPSTPGTTIQLKSGKKHTVTDPSAIYIDQAWVGRGPYGQQLDYRARGRAYMMRPAWTSLSVVLKEEATRIREHKDREEKRQKRRVGKNVWTPLPDRPITNHRAWYNW